LSGSVPVEDRPVGGPLFAKLERGDIVIASKLDRLFRSALDALKVVESLKQRGVKLHLLDLGGDIAGNGLSKLFLTIAAAFAEAERDRIRERIGQVKADQKARGRYLGGRVPFGFRRGDDGELVLHEAEQEAIREIALLRTQGMPLRAIATALHAKGPSDQPRGRGGRPKSHHWRISAKIQQTVRKLQARLPAMGVKRRSVPSPRGTVCHQCDVCGTLPRAAQREII
jgi:putative DNA-invertase from lambdoid prophage Rac